MQKYEIRDNFLIYSYIFCSNYKYKYWNIWGNDLTWYWGVFDYVVNHVSPCMVDVLFYIIMVSYEIKICLIYLKISFDINAQ